jgi:hypothetical protein
VKICFLSSVSSILIPYPNSHLKGMFITEKIMLE